VPSLRGAKELSTVASIPAGYTRHYVMEQGGTFQPRDVQDDPGFARLEEITPLVDTFKNMPWRKMPPLRSKPISRPMLGIFPRSFLYKAAGPS